MLSKAETISLKIFASRIRLETLKELKCLGFGHVGGAMSIVEILAVLYGKVMNVDTSHPTWPDRDWLVLSKGHAGPALYAALALKGFFPLQELETLNKPGTNLPSHCDLQKTTGVDMTTGSLGQGISTAIGIALGNRLDKRKNRTYLILGDGECNEGQVWEGVLFAAQHKVNNLVAFVDYNKQQIDGFTHDIMDLGDLAAKFKVFGWFVQETDGHDTAAIYAAIENTKGEREKPSAIILHTVKGKSCNFAEAIIDNHNMFFSDEMIDRAISCVSKELTDLEAESAALSLEEGDGA